MCTKKNYTVFYVTNLNKYLHCDTSVTIIMFINIGANDGSEKL